MPRLSSKLTFFYKRVFPFIMFGFLALIGVLGVVATLLAGKATVPTFLFWLPLLVVGSVAYIFVKKMILDLVDEVLDAGDALVVRNGNVEDHIALADITNVTYAQFSNPPRATLTLRNPGRFGDRITFCPVAPALRLPFSTLPAIEDLIKRVDLARRSGR